MEKEKQNKEAWILKVMQEHEGRLLGYAYRIVHSYELAQDIVQDTFLTLCKSDKDKIEQNLKAWLYKVCRNRALEILRKEKRMIELTETQLATEVCLEKTPDKAFECSDSFAVALKLIDKLPQKQQEVVYLKYQNGLSYREISEIAEISVSNVGFLLHTALAELRNQLQYQ